MRTVGILVDLRVFNQIRSGQTGYERLSLYNKAAQKHGLIPVYLCLEKMTSSAQKGYGYKYTNGKYHFGLLTIPRVIHNRALPFSRKLHKRLNRLKKRSIVFNGQNRYSKFYIHKLLIKSFANNLPSIKPYSITNLRTMMNKYDSLHIKPQSSSVGKGIMQIIHTDSDKWTMRMPARSYVAQEKIIIAKVNNLASKQKYLIQETIPLAKYKGNPYDIRVTLQRGIVGKWQVTGAFGKVARKGSHVTNVARGGSVIKPSILYENSVKAPSEVSYLVNQFSLGIARYLGKRLDRLADIGIDIGVNAVGKPYFIEMNGRDQRYGFKLLKMNLTYYRTYETPIAYAAYLLENNK